MARIVPLGGPQKGKSFELQGENRIEILPDGRLNFESSSAQLSISRTSDERWKLSLLDPQFPLYLNQVYRERAYLRSGDILSCTRSRRFPIEGDLSYRFLEGDSLSSSVEERLKSNADPQSIIDALTTTKSPRQCLAILYRLSNLISQTYSVGSLEKEVLATILDEFNADRVWLFVREGQGGEFCEFARCFRSHFESSNPLILEDVLQDVLLRREAILIRPSVEDNFAHSLPLQAAVYPALCIPLFKGVELLGVLYVEALREGGFCRDDLKLLAAVGRQIANVIERIRLLRIKQEKEKLEREMEDAERVQQFLIPKRIYQPPGVEVQAKYIFSQNLGGDYFDVIALDNGRTAVLIADVSGHNISSALVMCMFRSIVRQLCHQNPSPGEVLRECNAILVKDIVQGMFITTFLGMLDPLTFQFTYSCAGHPYPLYYKPKERKIELLKAGSLPLGILSQCVYPEELIYLEPGDGILAYTDGLTEAKNSYGQAFGCSKLREVLEESLHLTPHRLVELIYQRVRQFCGHRSPGDDISLLSLKVKESFSRHFYEISSRAEEIEPLLGKVLTLLESRGFCKLEYISLVLREALLNAILHGNRSNPGKSVFISLYLDDSKAHIQIRDEGEGFDTRRGVQDFRSLNQHSHHGRGLLLIQKYSDCVRFNEKGNEIYIEFLKKTY
ncbi:MAG: GAF domain-containing protein [Planctomycetota bacterium]|nr:MAG: GAF domain-containing protein [Planctomycetota bacterium]